MDTANGFPPGAAEEKLHGNSPASGCAAGFADARFHPAFRRLTDREANFVDSGVPTGLRNPAKPNFPCGDNSVSGESS